MPLLLTAARAAADLGNHGGPAIAGAYYATVDGNGAEGAAYFFTQPTTDRIFADGFDG